MMFWYLFEYNVFTTLGLFAVQGMTPKSIRSLGPSGKSIFSKKGGFDVMLYFFHLYFTFIFYSFFFLFYGGYYKKLLWTVLRSEYERNELFF